MQGIAAEAIGPSITLAVWIAIIVVRAVRGRPIDVPETVAIVAGVVTLQLLLDLHTRYFGDILVGALHLAYVAALRLRSNRDRRGRTSR